MEFIASILHSIGFNWHVALANFINFLIVLFILNKFVFKKVFAGIESRQDMIKQGLENASEAEHNLKKAIEKSADIIADSKKEGEKLFKTIIDKADAEARDTTLKASHDADKLRMGLQEKINSAQVEVENNFAKVAPELVAGLLKKALANIDEVTHNKILESIVK